MAGMTDIVRDHFKISFTDPDKNGQMVATFSFVDMVALTKRVQAWCGKVLALMEAEGVPGLSIDAERALPLFLSDTAPEAAAVLLIAEARAAAPAAPAWQSANLVTHLRSYPAAPPDCDALSVGYTADLMQKAADAIDLRDKAVKAKGEFRP
ncbi:unnamed protein product, partial [marine sediment metagenome]